MINLEPDLSRPELYINRELSLLAFNRRVFEQATDDSVPLLERLQFLCITSSNLDEFFEIRAAALKHQVEYGGTQTGPDQIKPAQTLNKISEISHRLVDDQYQLLNTTLLPALANEGIRFLRREEWNDDEAEWLKNYFEEELLPIISPIRLNPAHPFPRTLNKSLNFIVALDGKDAFGTRGGMAVVSAPRALPRLIRLPTSCSDGEAHFVFLSSIMHAHINHFFKGMKVKGCYQFRVTRNSNLFVDEEEIDDLLRALEGQLPSRRYGAAVRLEVADNCPKELYNFLLQKFELDEKELYLVAGPVNLHRLSALPDLVDRPNLAYPGTNPGLPARLLPGCDMFKVVSNNDVLLHHPFQSFQPVLDLIRQAAHDPNVLAIKQTLYRTVADSALLEALMDAARAGKEVTVVVELRARFDEATNISIASQLQETGVHVVYGVVGYKTHTKMLMVVRREHDKLKRYVHLGTGNYHQRTARLYTDYGYFTCDKKIGQDVHRLFMQLTTHSKVDPLERLLQSPFTLQTGLLERINRETELARNGKPARIIAKMNGLVSSPIIQALYTASRAGVSIDLIVRGICCLRPGVTNVSDNIRVRSIVGRYLEHTRVFYFQNIDEHEIMIASADWMPRNLVQRVEQCVPITNKKIRRRLLEDLELYLSDTVQAWQMLPDGQYQRICSKAAQQSISAQEILLGKYAEA